MKRNNIVDCTQLREVSQKVLMPMCQCLVHADRLVSLADFLALSAARYGQKSAAHARNLRTILWLACGTMWELTAAINRLNNQEVHRLVGHSEDLETIVQLGDKWRRDKGLEKIRHNVGFHVDKKGKLIARGLQALAESVDVACALEFDDTTQVTASAPLGEDALLRGVEASREYGHLPGSNQGASPQDGVGPTLARALNPLSVC